MRIDVVVDTPQFTTDTPIDGATITDRRRFEQVGRISGKIGKASLNNPESNENEPSDPRRIDAPWQVPVGVTQGNWDYVRANQIASDYDSFLDGDPLTRVDWQIIDRYLPAIDAQSEGNPGPVVADFGCGTGRTLKPLLERGYRGIGIDLSIPMLREFKKKTDQNLSQHACPLLLHANLVELDSLKSGSIDHGICMFSTLGMIQNSVHRSSFLRHVRRILKPGGQFILHAHNTWFHLRHPGGIRWAIGNACGCILGKNEFGDRIANYRGLKQMFIHSFRRRELWSDLTNSGFTDQTWFGIKPGQTVLDDRLPLASDLRLVGWVVVCR